MDSVIRPLILFFVLLVIFRLSGKRTIAQTTPFGLVLLLIISETVQETLTHGDQSFTNAIILVITLVMADVGLSVLKRWKPIDRMVEGTAIIIVEDGKPHFNRMKKSRIDVSDIMQAARASQGLEHMEQIKFAVLEKDGNITIIPYNN